MPATHLGKCLKIFAKIPENPENILKKPEKYLKKNNLKNTNNKKRKIAEKYLKNPEKHLKSNWKIPEKKLEKYLKKYLKKMPEKIVGKDLTRIRNKKQKLKYTEDNGIKTLRSGC